MSDSSKEQRRTLDEWYKLVTQCRQSGLSDEQWCLCNGIKKYSLYSAIKRLRQKAYAVPKPMRNSHDEIHDLTIPKQDSKNVRYGVNYTNISQFKCLYLCIICFGLGNGQRKDNQ